jgi:hypothetical protein
MRYYNLFNQDDPGPILSKPARDRDQALALFGEKLGVRLTLSEQPVVAPYMLSESDHNVHWLKPTIPVWTSD